ncbi:hypothetical protein MASR2M78_08650 [Treponema sp.]
MKRIDLTGTWSLTFTPAPGEKEEAALNVAQKTIPCSVPGDSHSALLASSLISDPYFNKNEILLQGLGRGDFVFEKSFDLDAADLAAKNAFLHFDSIDTIAEIFVNDVELAQSANMFRRIRIDLNGFIQPGKNTLRVVCRSAEAEAVRRATELPYVVPYNVSPVQSPHRNLVRKTQCHSGWDWGPCLMVAGIYGDTYIGLSDNGRIERFSARTVKETGSTWRIKAELEYLYQGAGPGTGTNGSTSANTKPALTLLDAEGKLVASKLKLCPSKRVPTCLG